MTDMSNLMVGRSSAIQAVRDLVEKVAPDRRHGADLRRERLGQGAGRAGHPCTQSAAVPVRFSASTAAHCRRP